MQQERLRALGQMASGIAHDINNAISPMSLYTESLLEREPNLSERARGYLVTIQRAIDDVARTVARMREFYREREAQLTLERVELNRAIRQVVELTRPRWSDMPQQRGAMIDLQDGAVRVAARDHGRRTRNSRRADQPGVQCGRCDADGRHDHGAHPRAEVAPRRPRSARSSRWATPASGMDEDTRRRCLEPFYTTKGERGTGLGLAMVYGMVQRHSAELEIDSALGAGHDGAPSFPSHTASIVAPAQVDESDAIGPAAAHSPGR